MECFYRDVCKREKEEVKCGDGSVISDVPLFSGHKLCFLVANMGLEMEMGQTQLNV